MQRRSPLPIIIVILLLVISAGAYYVFIYSVPKVVDNSLTASGSVEAVTVSIAPEQTGKVVSVGAATGQLVKSGDMLFRLDDTLLKAQRDVAAAALETSRAAVTTAEAAAQVAQAGYDATLEAALVEDKANRTADWTVAKPSEFSQGSWYFTRSEQYTALQSEAVLAADALKSAQDNLKFVQEKATSAEFLDAEKRLTLARVDFQTATDLLDRANTATDGQDLKDEAQNLFDDAKTELADATTAYDDALTTEGAADLLQARARLQIAQERSDMIADRMRAMQTGLLSPKVVSAQKSLDQANAAAAQARLAIAQAEANLKLIDTQLSRLVVSSPLDGVVLLRNVEPGEVVSPAAGLFTLGRLDALTLTVYISEDRYGEISLGQVVQISVDSFPGQVFNGSVIEISDQAEFTPRNVQTAEGRKSTVFAIKLSVENPEGKLKPGMPADVVFK